MHEASEAPNVQIHESQIKTQKECPSTKKHMEQGLGEMLVLLR